MPNPKTLLLLVFAAALMAPSAGGPRVDHIGNYNFRVEIDGFDAVGFSSVEGLEFALEIVESPTGGASRAGRLKFENLTLKRGFTGNSVFMEWFDDVGKGNSDPNALREIKIEVFGPEGGTLAQFTYSECFLQAVALDGLDQNDKGGVIEERLTVVCGRLDFRRAP